MTFVIVAVSVLAFAPSAVGQYETGDAETPGITDGLPGLVQAVEDAGEQTGVYTEPYWFDERGLTGTWWCHQAHVAGNDIPSYGDPDHLAVCEQWADDHVICYIFWVAGEWDGTFLCMYY